MSSTDIPIEYATALKAVWSAIVKVKKGEALPDDLSENTRLFYADDIDEPALNIDSLGMLGIISSIEQELGLRLPLDLEFETLNTVGDLAVFLTTIGSVGEDGRLSEAPPGS
jgi:acyl carrier protein